jgi:acyl-coenzyme A thioesterase PaaI-like protein
MGTDGSTGHEGREASAPPERRGTEGTRGLAALIEALRTLQDDVAAAAPTPEVSAEAETLLRAASALVRPFALPLDQQPAGRMSDVPGRGQTLGPVTRIEERTATHLRGTVRFGRFHVGVGAVHGGAIPLLFDEILGLVAGSPDGPMLRTAYLHVDYRSLTPADTDLVFEARVVRQEGRKHFRTGTLSDGDRLCAEAEALFVTVPRPGDRQGAPSG